jgi:hypothetical protein
VSLRGLGEARGKEGCRDSAGLINVFSSLRLKTLEDKTLGILKCFILLSILF